MSTYPAHAGFMNENEALKCADVDAWRGWLTANGRSERSVRLVVQREKSGLNLGAAVEHALCFADENFRAFPPSARRTILEWITLAKRAETRQRRIDQTVEQAAAGNRVRRQG